MSCSVTCASRITHFDDAPAPFAYRVAVGIVKVYDLPKVQIFMYGHDTPRGRHQSSTRAAKVVDAGHSQYVYNIGSGHGSLNGLVSQIQSLMHKKIEINYRLHRDFDVLTSILDISKVRTELGWSPRWGLADGLEVTLEAIERISRVHLDR